MDDRSCVDNGRPSKMVAIKIGHWEWRPAGARRACSAAYHACGARASANNKNPGERPGLCSDL